MPPIKVVHLIDGLTMGGAEMMLYKVVSRMDRTKFEGVVIAFMEEGPRSEDDRGGGSTCLVAGYGTGQTFRKSLLHPRKSATP